MSTATAPNKTNGRSTRNAMSLSTTKRSSRSATPIKDVEKTPTKNSQQIEKSIKIVVAEEISKILEETPTELVEKVAAPAKTSKKVVEDEKSEKSATKSHKKSEEDKSEKSAAKSHKKSEEDKPVKEKSVTPEKPKEEKTNGVEQKTNGVEEEGKDKKEVKPKMDAKTNGTEEKHENGVATEEACVKNGNTNGEEGDVIIIEADKPSSVEIMDEPMLTLSEDDEKSSLHDSFDVECAFESSSPTFSPKGNRSMTRRSQAKSIPTPETPKTIALDNILEKASTSNGASDDEFIVVDDSEKESNAGTDIIIDDVSSTEMQDVTLPSRNSPFRRSPRLMENASLIANYSGSTTRDLSIDENSNGHDSLNEDSLNTTNETVGERSLNYGRSLRSISGRKSVRPLREVSFRNMKRQTDASRLKNAGNDTQTSMNVTVGTDLNSTIGSRDANKSLKRERSSTPVYCEETENKRFKSEAGSTTNFIMNYVPSPMTALRRRFYGARITCSTPKKASTSKPAEVKTETTNLDGANHSQNCTEVALINDDAKKNWCSIM